MSLRWVAPAALLLAACGGSPRPEPPETMKATFVGCEWGEQRAGGVSIYSYACGPAHGDVRLVGDESLPGFYLQSGDGARQVAIRLFAKAPGLPVTEVTEAVRAASPGPHSATCALEPSEDFSDDGVTRFVFAPTGEARVAWETDQQEPPCGPLGVGLVGDRSFQVVEGAPDKVAFIEWGSEIQIFDAATLRAAP